jgi:hypothetical protein
MSAYPQYSTLHSVLLFYIKKKMSYMTIPLLAGKLTTFETLGEELFNKCSN